MCKLRLSEYKLGNLLDSAKVLRYIWYFVAFYLTFKQKVVQRSREKIRIV